jgi:Mg-chelatase subunit ChlD/type II secretory pathway pseudopilin PulG
MNEHTPESNREELEARLTALLLGELPEDQAAALRREIEHDSELAKLYRQLEKTIVLVREVAAPAADEEIKEPATPLRLSEDRRQKLLAHFKTVAPKEFANPRKREVRWLVEMCAAAAIIGILASLAMPNLSGSARKKSARLKLASVDQAKSEYLRDGGHSSVATTTDQTSARKAADEAFQMAQKTQLSDQVDVLSEGDAIANDPRKTRALPKDRPPAVAAATPPNDSNGHDFFVAGSADSPTPQTPKPPSNNIILPAAALAAGVQANGASNVYNLNAVGYANVPAQPGFMFQSNPFETTTNGIVAGEVTNPAIMLAYKTEPQTPTALPSLQPASPTPAGNATVTFATTNSFAFNYSVAPHEPASASPTNTPLGLVAGDPAWVGVLERPDVPHSSSNRFIGRYAWQVPPQELAQARESLQSLHNYASSGKAPEANKLEEHAPSKQQEPIDAATGLPVPATPAEAPAATPLAASGTLTMSDSKSPEFDIATKSREVTPTDSTPRQAAAAPQGGAGHVVQQFDAEALDKGVNSNSRTYAANGNSQQTVPILYANPSDIQQALPTLSSVQNPPVQRETQAQLDAKTSRLHDRVLHVDTDTIDAIIKAEKQALASAPNSSTVSPQGRFPSARREGVSGGGGSSGGAIRAVTRTNDMAEIQRSLLKFFNDAGVNLTNAGDTLFYNDRDGTLMVRGTPQQLAQVEAMTKSLSNSNVTQNVGKHQLLLNADPRDVQQAFQDLLNRNKELQFHGIGNYFQGIGAINNGNALTPDNFANGLSSPGRHTAGTATNGTGVLGGPSYLAASSNDLDVTVTAINPNPSTQNPQTDRSAGTASPSGALVASGVNATPGQSQPLLGDVPVLGSLSRSTSAPAAYAMGGGAKPPELALALPTTPSAGVTAGRIDAYSLGPLRVPNATNLVVWSAAGSGVLAGTNVPDGQYRLYYDLNRNPTAPGLSGPTVASSPQPTAVDEAILRQPAKVSTESGREKESTGRARKLEMQLAENDSKISAAQSKTDNLRSKSTFQSRLAGIVNRVAASGETNPEKMDLAAAKTAPEEIIQGGVIDSEEADLTQVLNIYAKLVHRTVLQPTNLSARNIVLETQTPLTRSEAVQALDAVLGMNGIGMINVGDQFVKAVPLAQVNQEAGAFNKKTAEQLADLSPYVTHVVELKNAKPTEIVPFLKSLASISNSIVAIDKSGIIVLRDKPEVVRQLLEVIREKDSDKAAPAAPRPSPSADAPVPQPEIQTHDNAFSTFSMNVSDVSFKLAAASLEKGMLPEPASIRSEEFINAFDYRDPEAPPGVPVAFAYDRARYPFAQNRDLLRFSLKTAAEGREPGRPLNLVLLLDTSGSMERADRVRIIHEALRVLAAQLTPNDVFSVVTFARTPRLWVDGIPGHQAGKAAEEVGNITPEGGTNLEEAMNLAYQTALRHYLANGVNRVVLLTDGAANLGNVDPAVLKQKVEANRKQGISLDCFGVGWEGYNDDLLEVLTRDGNGRYGFINTPEEAATDFAGQLAGALRVAAADVKVQVEFNPTRVTAYRQIGYAKHQLTKEQFRDNTVAAAQLAAAESGNALYVVEVNPRGEGPLCTVRVRYRVPATDEVHEHEWAVPYTGNAPALEQSAPALKLAATAAAFSEWLAASPYAADVTPERLLGYLNGVPEICGADARPKKLEWMLHQAQSIEGKR